MTVSKERDLTEGRPKTGRVWKPKQSTRTSVQVRQGVRNHFSTTFEEKMLKKAAKEQMKELERTMNEESRSKAIEERERREARVKQRADNEFKTATYQVVNPQKLKTMSKKQLRQIKKTSVSKSGAVEMVSPWGPSK